MGRIYIKNIILTLYTSLYPPVLPEFIKRYLRSHTLYYKPSLQFVSYCCWMRKFCVLFRNQLIIIKFQTYMCLPCHNLVIIYQQENWKLFCNTHMEVFVVPNPRNIILIYHLNLFTCYILLILHTVFNTAVRISYVYLVLLYLVSCNCKINVISSNL